MSTKTCTKCRTLKPLDDFYRDSSRSDGRSHQCKECKRPKVRATVREWKAANRQATLAQKARYRSRHKGRIAIDNAIRQAKRTADRLGVNTEPYTVAELVEAWGERHEWHCVYCGTADALSIDHVHPMNRGGVNALANIVPACVACNQSKRSKPVGEFLAGKHVPEVHGPGRYAHAVNVLHRAASPFLDFQE
ncbi:HNH endonuclease [Saccharothrix syringae]|uniref:HNH endonuclease n=1 Tax=Saccharothrix syringae TaxID=103733 RepID=A0A5Q0HAR2_SACSY|nr:HNH endonuclease [Saccharothrix syringae]QFZ23338.1 HNH endonuclease [Saccharothrix syringae]